MPVEDVADPVEDLVATVADLKVRVEGLERQMAALKQPEKVETHEPGEDPPTVHASFDQSKVFKEEDFA